MLPKQHILIKWVASLVMIGSLLLLTSANYWAYGFHKSQQKCAAAGQMAEEEGTDAPTNVPNPTEEKASGSLQTISEYLHDNHHSLECPFITFSRKHLSEDSDLTMHHPEMLTPPPKA